MVQQYYDSREMVSQMALDLEAKAGRIGAAFRVGIRTELEELPADKSRNAVTVKVEQTSTGTIISLQIAEWIEPIKKVQLKQKFKTYLESIGARKGVCSGPIPTTLVSLINKNL